MRTRSRGVFRNVEEERGPGPGSRGAVIKADSAVIFTAHCITALRCCIPHAAQLLEQSEKFGATAQLAEEERGHSPRSKKATLASAPRTDLLGALGQPVQSAMWSLDWCATAVHIQLRLVVKDCSSGGGGTFHWATACWGWTEVCKVNCVQDWLLGCGGGGLQCGVWCWWTGRAWDWLQLHVGRFQGRALPSSPSIFFSASTCALMSLPPLLYQVEISGGFACF